MDNFDNKRNRDLDITLGGINTFDSTESTENTENTESTEYTDNIEDTAIEEVYETVEEQEEYAQEPTEGEEARGVPIPEEDHRADEVLSGMAIDTVRGHYTFFDLAVLITTVFAVALTLLLMRETDRYGEDNVKLSFQSFMDGSYTQAMSNRYISRLNIDTLKEKIENITGHLYGFGGVAQALPEDEISPDDQPSTGYVTNFPEYTTTTAESASETLQQTTGEVSAVVDPELTGSPVTMKPSSITIETSFTGKVSRYTTLTSEFTTTGTYKPTATKPKTTAPTATKPETTKSEATTSKTTEAETKPPQSVSETTASSSSETTPTTSETTTTASETTPDTSSETNSETTTPASEVTQEEPAVTTTPPETPEP